MLLVWVNGELSPRLHHEDTVWCESGCGDYRAEIYTRTKSLYRDNANFRKRVEKKDPLTLLRQHKRFFITCIVD